MRGAHTLAVAASIFAGVVACSNRNPYNCTASDQCVLGGAPGVCEPEGFCSFSDPGCPGGQRFEPNAGNGLGGTCTDFVMPDAPCGALGQACCSGEPACSAGAFCTSGTCQQCVTDVAPGRRFACFLKDGGTVWCSGENNLGQLGNGMSGTSSAVPVQVVDGTGPITDATAIGTAFNSACAVRTGGTVWCWGQGSTGELGNGMSNDQDVAVRVVKAGNVPLDTVTEVDGGFTHFCARTTTNEIWCWGRNNNGQLGDGTTAAAVPSRNIAGPVRVSAGGASFTGALDVSSGGDYICVHRAGDQVWCWGSNNSGQFGDGTNNGRLVPGMITTTTSFGSGLNHTCWVNTDTTVSCVGANYHAQLGLGIGGQFNGGDELTAQTVITAVDGPPFMGAVEVALGSSMSCARMATGHVFCWGDSPHGQTGTGASSAVPVEVMKRVAAGTVPLANVDRMVAHQAHVCAHTTDAGWLCWGRNRDGELGDGGFLNHGFATPLSLSCP